MAAATSQTAMVPELVDDSGHLAEMPPDAASAYGVYAGDANRSLRRTALMLNIPAGTVRTWGYRYRWAARVKLEDAEVGQGSLDRALTFAAGLRMAALQSLAQALGANQFSLATGELIGPDWKARNDAAKALLDRSGMRTHFAEQRGFTASGAEDDDSPDLSRLGSEASDDDVLDELIRLRRLQS